MAEFPALPFFTDAYLADTRHLTTIQHGAYLLLLFTAWRMPDCALPDDDECLARWAGMDARTWQRHRAAVMAFWTLGEDQRWRQGRLSDERKYVEYQRSKNSAAANSRWLKTKDRHNATAYAKPMPKPCEPTPTPTPTPKPHKADQYSELGNNGFNTHKKAFARAPIVADLDGIVSPRFNEFWERYPRKQHRTEAAGAWISMVHTGNDTAVLLCLDRYLASDEVARGVVQNPDKWLFEQGRSGWSGSWPARQQVERKLSKAESVAERGRELFRQEMAKNGTRTR